MERNINLDDKEYDMYGQQFILKGIAFSTIAFAVLSNSVPVLADTMDGNRIEMAYPRSGYLNTAKDYNVYCTYVRDLGYQLPISTTIEYNSDGTILWSWDNGIGDVPIFIHGTQLDDVGSFKVKAGRYIGGYAHLSQGGDWYESYEYRLYPMMQYNGMDILLTDWTDIIFKVGPDNIIRMENSNPNLPAEAKIGFGPIEANSYCSSSAYGFYESTWSEFSYWQMFLDFKLVPVFMNTNAMDSIGEDLGEKDIPVFDLYGNRVDRNNMSSGVYICNGKKLLVK